MTLVRRRSGWGKFYTPAAVALLFLTTHSLVGRGFVAAQTAALEPAQNIANQDGNAFARLRRGDIEAYELKQASADDFEISPAVVAIFGDSRLKHAVHVNDVEFSPDGRVIASSSNDGTVRVWDAGTAEEIQRFYTRSVPDKGATYASDVCFSPDGKILAATAPRIGVFFWDLTTGEETRVVQDRKPVKTIAFHPTDLLVATGHELEASLWDATTGRRLVTFSKDADRLWRLRGSSLAKVQVAFTADGSSLVTGHPDGSIRYWDIHSGNLIKTVDTHKAAEQHESAVTSFAFSRDYVFMAASYGDGTVKVWREPTGQLLHELNAHDSQVCAVAFHPTQDILVSSGLGGQLRLWDYETGLMLKELSGGRRSGVGAMSFRPDGRLLALASTSVKVLDTETGQPAFDVQGHDGAIHCLIAGEDSTSLITAGADGAVLQWDVRSGLARRLIDVGQWVAWAQLNQDRKLAAVEIDGTTKIWDLSAQRVEQVWWSGLPMRPQPAMSPDGRWLASRAIPPARFGSLDIWNARTGGPHGRIEPGEGTPFFSPDSKRLIFVRGTSVDRKCRVSIWDVDKLALQMEGPDLGLRDISASALTAEGNTLAIAGRKRSAEEGPATVILLWDVQQQEVRLTLDHGSASPKKLAWSPDGQRLASLVDAKVHLWDVEDGNLRETIPVARPEYWQVRDIAFASDSRHVVVAMGNGTLQVLRLMVEPDDVVK